MFLKIVLFPIYCIFLSFVYFYKFVISPCLPKACKFIPSCSSFAVGAIKSFGPIKGGVLTIKRLCRCTPKSKGGFDPVPSNIKGDEKWIF